VQAPIFHGEFELTIDEKGRLPLPKEIRTKISSGHGTSFYIIVGTQNRVAWIYPDKYYEELAMERKPSMLNSREEMEYLRMTFAMAILREPDQQGRLLIPTRTLERTVVKNERLVTLVGVFDHLELWPRAAWETERENLIARSNDITESATGHGTPRSP